jgi:hypothetical protein
MPWRWKNTCKFQWYMVGKMHVQRIAGHRSAL